MTTSHLANFCTKSTFAKAYVLSQSCNPTNIEFRSYRLWSQCLTDLTSDSRFLIIIPQCLLYYVPAENSKDSASISEEEDSSINDLANTTFSTINSIPSTKPKSLAEEILPNFAIIWVKCLNSTSNRKVYVGFTGVVVSVLIRLTIFSNFSVLYVCICPGSVFQWEFNGSVCFVIRLTIFGNFSVLYVCICPGPVFQWEFNGGVCCVIKLTIFGKFLCYMYAYALYTNFGANSVITVILSSEDHILQMYDMVITRHHFSVWIQSWLWSCHLKTIFWKYMIESSSGIIFQCKFSCDSDYVIWKPY